jgi:hypothetical protein
MGKIILLLFLFIGALFFSAWMLTVYINIAHNHWWKTIPLMPYSTALALISLMVVMAALGKGVIRLIGEDE